MNILIEGENQKNYYAKLHEAYRTGLRRTFNVKFWGKGYEEYDESVKSFVRIKEKLFGDEQIDFLPLTDCYDPQNYAKGISYCDLDKINCKKIIMLCDFWSEASCKFSEYEEFIESLKIDYIFSFFRYPLNAWKKSKIYNKLIWFPPSFDPLIFNDWKKEKIWDVGNLNASIRTFDKFYPERYNMHMILSGMEDIKYFTARHPGSGMKAPNTPLIGKSFSEAINSCKLFVTSGNLIYRNYTPKYVEIMASKTCLLAFEPMDSELIGLVDGINYVKIDEHNLEEKVRYYINHDQERERIAENGYQFVLNNYSCYALALRIYTELRMRL